MKILMVGLGSIGQRHLRNIISLLGEKAEISAYRVRKEQEVVTPTLGIESGTSLDDKYGYTVYTDLDEALALGPDATFICNPNSMHVPVALKAAQAGSHLFIEKPLSNALDGVSELQATVADKRLVAFVAFQLRFHPCVKKLQELVASGRAGRILSVQAEVGEYLPNWHKWEDYRRMYASRKDQGGGVVLTQIHEIDYLLSMFGTPESVYALGGQLSSLDVDVEDNVDVLFSFQHQEHLVPCYLHMDYLQRPASRKCRVIGEEAAIYMDLAASRVSVTDTAGAEEVFDSADLDRNQLFTDELRHFFACIEGTEKPLVDLNTALEGMRIALATKASMLSGKTKSL